MGRLKIHLNDNERKRAWRKNRPTKEQKRALDRLYKFKIENPEYIPPKETVAGRIQRKKEREANKPFIAIDGEGYSQGETHYYTMLSSSEDHTIENWRFGLSTEDCFKFLHQYAGKGILVGFFTSYDVNMMLKDFDYDSLSELYHKGACCWNEWFVEWFPSKTFCLTKEGKSITWFDVFGFFQKSFIKTLEDWKIEVPKEITEGKSQRSSFSQKERASIKKYNVMECNLLVELMNKLRQAARDAECEPKRFHGAGAIATTVLKKYKVDSFNSEVPPEIQNVFLSAYFGGRNQVLQIGEIDSGFAHDINSAYPFALRELPTSIGTWSLTKKKLSDNKWSVYKVRWNLPTSFVITPFPVRYKGNIHWPLKGSGYYWQPEVATAMKYFGKYIKVEACYEFEPENSYLPFSFIDTLYSKRREFIRDDNDAQLVIKLAINALYGKTAQSIGFKDQKPPFQNFFWAGYTTSKTRAMVLELASKNPESIISFATDGVLATEKLTEHNLTKQLGGWSVEDVSNLFILQPGVYCFDDAEHKEKIRSRGFSRKSVDYNELRKVWREDGILGQFHYTERRFLGLGATLRSKLKGWRTWIEQEREINFTPNSGIVGLEKGKSIRVFPDTFITKLSEPYELKDKWMDDYNRDELEQ